MPTERANDLAHQCTELVRRGTDFSTVWSALLKNHTLVERIPAPGLEHEHDRHLLNIPLVTGELLIFDAEVREFRVQ